MVKNRSNRLALLVCPARPPNATCRRRSRVACRARRTVQQKARLLACETASTFFLRQYLSYPFCDTDRKSGVRTAISKLQSARASRRERRDRCSGRDVWCRCPCSCSLRLLLRRRFAKRKRKSPAQRAVQPGARDCPTKPTMSTARFTDELRASCIEEWNRVINHQFTTELATGEISRDVLRKYLIQVGSSPTRLDRNNSSKVPRHKPQDHRFLDSFVVLLSSMVAKARCLEDRIPGCQFLALITGDENNYFQRSFDSYAATPRDVRFQTKM